jgi:hypothetical protein
MYLLKDNQFIVTKAQYTAEEFIQKRIKSIVNLNRNMSNFN